MVLLVPELDPLGFHQRIRNNRSEPWHARVVGGPFSDGIRSTQSSHRLSAYLSRSSEPVSEQCESPLCFLYLKGITWIGVAVVTMTKPSEYVLAPLRECAD